MKLSPRIPKILRWRAPSTPIHQAKIPPSSCCTVSRKGRKICGSRSSDRSKREASLLVREVLRRATFKTLRGGLASRYCPPLLLAVPSYSFPPRKLSHPPRSLTPHTHARARARIHTYVSLRPLAAAQNPTRSTAAEHTLSRSCSWQCDLVGSWTDPLMRDRRLTSWTTDSILVLTCIHDQNTVNWSKSRTELIIE